MLLQKTKQLKNLYDCVSCYCGHKQRRVWFENKSNGSVYICTCWSVNGVATGVIEGAVGKLEWETKITAIKLVSLNKIKDW